MASSQTVRRCEKAMTVRMPACHTAALSRRSPSPSFASMIRDKTLQSVCAALQNRAAVDFARKTVKAGYHQFFPTAILQVDMMVDEAFDRLGASQEGTVDVTRLNDATSLLLERTFRRRDKSFWFNSVYNHYKTQLKPETDVRFLAPLLTGPRVLDYGCGSGYLSARLAREGYNVFTTDVLDYRYDEARSLPFVKMTSATDLGYPDGSIDTALVQAVLHHVDPDDLPEVIRLLMRVASHVVIKEDVYGLRTDDPGVAEVLAKQALFRAYVALPSSTQYQALILIDFYANAIAQGITEMNMPFGFKTVPEWQGILEINGLAVRKTLVTGFELARMHTSCFAWFVCEREC